MDVKIQNRNRPEIKPEVVEGLIDSLKEMVTRKNAEIQKAFCDHGGDWFSISLQVKLREINESKIGASVQMSFSKGKIKQGYQDIIDTKQIPMFELEKFE